MEMEEEEMEREDLERDWRLKGERGRIWGKKGEGAVGGRWRQGKEKKEKKMKRKRKKGKR